MAHYAFLDGNNVVVEVITGIDENERIEGLSPEEWYGNFRNLRCIRTSYNDNIRGHYAALGDTYDDDLDIFINPQPFPSWTMTAEGRWEAPVALPNNGGPYFWNEESGFWETPTSDEGGD